MKSEITRPSKLAGLALALLLFCLPGCGDSSPASTANNTSPALSKAQYLKQGNAICQEGFEKKDRAVAKALREAPQPTSKKAQLAAAEAAIGPFGEMIEELGGLEAPAGDDAQVSRFLGQFEAALKQAEDEPQALVTKNPFSQAGEAAQAYGLTACV
jgi:hypothetical protein